MTDERPDPRDAAEAAIRGLADDQWNAVMRDSRMPMQARLRALQRQLRTLGFEAEAALVCDARATIAYAGARIDEVSSLCSRPAIAGDVERAVLVGFMRRAALDAKHALTFSAEELVEDQPC